MSSLLSSFRSVRTRTTELCRHLEPEDFVVQSMPDASPAKWHMAHTSWFFERFILRPFLPGYRVFNERFHFLFNSYYYSVGNMHPRPERGLLSRPLVQEVLQYRAHVDEAIERLLEQADAEQEISSRMVLGLNHEQQHQELLLTDIKSAFFLNPELPAVNPELMVPEPGLAAPLRFAHRDSCMARIGLDTGNFLFDNETPRHDVFLPDHAMGSRLVTNAEFREFIEDGAYGDSGLWLSDGWAVIQQRGWSRPLYWSEDLQSEFTLGGQRELDLNAPVTHVSYYEADAFARWSDSRLPTEAEWEVAAAEQTVSGNLLDAGFWHPVAAAGGANQFFGDVWEWTSSSYAPYPGFKPLSGSLGEYNGKFMCNQMTVRGGSCVTAADHIRPSYRSFFYPDARWQFLGIRLAKDRPSEGGL